MLIEATSNSVQPPYFFLHMWKSEGSWRDWEYGQGFVSVFFFLSWCFFICWVCTYSFLETLIVTRFFKPCACSSWLIFLCSFGGWYWHVENLLKPASKSFTINMGILRRELPGHTSGRFSLKSSRRKQPDLPHFYTLHF